MVRTASFREASSPAITIPWAKRLVLNIEATEEIYSLDDLISFTCLGKGKLCVNIRSAHQKLNLRLLLELMRVWVGYGVGRKLLTDGLILQLREGVPVHNVWGCLREGQKKVECSTQNRTLPGESVT
jgi:hypothetical protein